MDATTLLRHDHEAVDRLFTQLVGTGPADLSSRRMVFRLIKSELEAHARIEEDVFYPAVMRLRSARARESVRAALEDHQVIDGILAEVDQMEPDDPRFATRVSALRQSVERHVESEEGALFAEARIHLTDERLETLGRQMEKRRREFVAKGMVEELEAVGATASGGGPGASGPDQKADPAR